MSVSPQDVEKVALLARLAISESDLPEVTERFGRVLGLVDELNTIDTETVVPMSNPHDTVSYTHLTLPTKQMV